MLEVPIRVELLQRGGLAHGGVLSYAAENALTFSGARFWGRASWISEYKIN